MFTLFYVKNILCNYSHSYICDTWLDKHLLSQVSCYYSVLYMWLKGHLLSPVTCHSSVLYMQQKGTCSHITHLHFIYGQKGTFHIRPLSSHIYNVVVVEGHLSSHASQRTLTMFVWSCRTPLSTPHVPQLPQTQSETFDLSHINTIIVFI